MWSVPTYRPPRSQLLDFARPPALIADLGVRHRRRYWCSWHMRRSKVRRAATMAGLHAVHNGRWSFPWLAMVAFCRSHSPRPIQLRRRTRRSSYRVVPLKRSKKKRPRNAVGNSRCAGEAEGCRSNDWLGLLPRPLTTLTSTITPRRATHTHDIYERMMLACTNRSTTRILLSSISNAGPEIRRWSMGYKMEQFMTELK
jgi:hypothetical protein